MWSGSKEPETHRECPRPDAGFRLVANPEASYDQLAQTAGTLGIAITRQAIEQRLTLEAADTLKATLEAAAGHVIATDPQALPLLKQFNGVYLARQHLDTSPAMCSMSPARAPEIERTPAKLP